MFFQVIIVSFLVKKMQPTGEATQMVGEVVLKEAMAKVGMRMEWLEKETDSEHEALPATRQFRSNYHEGCTSSGQED